MTDPGPMILVVDDDVVLLKLMKRNLELEGYRAVTASDGDAAIRIIATEQPDLVILDIMMPGMDGFQVCERVREFSQVPIVMLTARGRPEDVVHGLSVGADDYVVKPFGIDVVLARAKAVLRRSQPAADTAPPTFSSDDLCIDFSRRRVVLCGREVMLTATEYEILRLLASNVGNTITHEHILSYVWGREYRADTHILQAAINRLRSKIGDSGQRHKYILTRVGIGYAFRTPDAAGGQL